LVLSEECPFSGGDAMEVLEATGVVKTFREGSESVSVLKGATLSLARGEIVALEGSSGSGKTTFLTILGCMLTPTSGRDRGP
jgi:putative ABC transport system ATP-binding protein